MTAPDAATVRSWSKVDFAALGFASDDDLQRLVDRAVAYVKWASGQKVDSSTDDALAPLIEEVIQYKTEALGFQAQEDLAETAGDFMLISSFSVGSYSETRRSLTELKEAGMIDADPRVNAALWPILTDDQRDFWMEWISGVNAPAGSVTEVVWGGGFGYGGDAYSEVPFSFPIWPN